MNEVEKPKPSKGEADALKEEKAKEKARLEEDERRRQEDEERRKQSGRE
jgi:hypothetical protein